MIQNQPTSPGAADEAWTTPAASWHSPVVTPAPGSEPPAAGGQKIAYPGDNDAGGRDDVAASVSEAIANAMARQAELQRDTYGQGSVIGDLMNLPDVPTAHSKHVGGDGDGYMAG